MENRNRDATVCNLVGLSGALLEPYNGYVEETIMGDYGNYNCLLDKRERGRRVP